MVDSGVENDLERDGVAATTPAGHPSTAEEVANGIVFLASTAASNIQGVVLPVDGGRLAV